MFVVCLCVCVCVCVCVYMHLNVCAFKEELVIVLRSIYVILISNANAQTNNISKRKQLWWMHIIYHAVASLQCAPVP